MTYTTTSRALLTVCSFFLALTAYAQTTLVTTNSVFQYYDNGAEPADDADNNPWYSTDYDASWSSFEGPLGYGAGDHNEIINSSSNTVYFRHQWNIESTTDFDLMFLTLLYNDGAIIYLNGNVINRTNMPQGAVDYSTTALSNVVDQQVRNLALPHLFIEGINTVAIEVHNSADGGDSNLSFGLEVIEYHEICEVLGQPCNDLNSNTINDVFNSDCECEGFACDVEAYAGETQEINEGQSATLEAQGGGTYFWSTGETGTTIIVSPTTNTGYSVTVTDENGCEDFDDVMVDVIPCSAVADAGEDINIELGETTTLTSSESEAYMWNTGDFTQSISVSPVEDITYTVTITDENGCYAEDDVNVFVNSCLVGAPCNDDSDGTYDDQLNENCECVGVPCQMEVDIAGDGYINLGDTATIVAAGGINFIWDNGAIGSVLVVSPTETTTYLVNVIADNGCEEFGSFTVEVSPCTVGEACNDDSDGTYDDQLNENCECVGALCNMDVQIIGDDRISLGSIATIVVEGGINYIWDNGAISSILEVSPAETTTYNVTVIADNGCEEFASFTVTVINDFDLDVRGGAIINLGQSAILSASGADSYVWSNGMEGAQIEVSPAETTTYTVEATKGNAVQYASVKVTVIDDFDLDIFGGAIINLGATAVLSAEGADTYVWSNGMEGAQIEVSPAETTTYTVEATKGNAVKYASVKVTVIDDFDLDIFGGALINLGETAVLSAEGADTYVWSNGMEGAQIEVSPMETTTYTVEASKGSAMKFASVTVFVVEPECIEGTPCDDSVASTYGDTINELCNCVGFDCDMEVAIEGDASIIEGESATIAASGGASYEWNNGMTNSTITVFPATTTNYNVIITDSNGCVDVASFLVEVIPYYCAIGYPCTDHNAETYSDAIGEDCECIGVPCEMNTSFAGNTEIYVGESTTIVAEGGISFEWENGSTSPGIELSPNTTSNYFVTITDINGCSEVASVIINVLDCDVQPEVVSFYNIFQGEQINITAAGGAYYEWSNGSTDSVITVAPNETSTFEVTVFDNEFCFETVSIVVDVFEDNCLLGSSCDDGNPSTTNGIINENCECISVIEGGDGSEAGSKVEDETTTSTGTAETKTEDQTEIDDTPMEDCTPITSFFPQTKLKHYGTGASVTKYEFANLQSGLSFSISGITAKLATTEKSKYIDVVDVSYINESGQEVSYGTFSGEVINEVEVNITENIQEVIISLVDGYDGIAPKVSISLGNISSCSIDRQGVSAQSNGLQAAQQELIEVSLQSNLVNGRLMLNIDNPNVSSQPIYAVVIDVNGVPVLPDALSGDVLPGTQSEYIDIASLRPGLYYLKTKVGRQTVTLKFVVAE